MPATYDGNPVNVAFGSPVAISEPIDADAPNAASVNTPLNKLADYSELFRSTLELLQLVNLRASPVANPFAGATSVSVGPWRGREFMAVTDNGAGVAGGIFQSTEGSGGLLGWGAQANPVVQSFRSITGDGVSTDWVAVGYAGAILKDSVSQVSGTAQQLNKVIFANALYVAVGQAGTILTSPDGATWTSRAGVNAAHNVLGVAYGAGKFIAITDAQTIVTSPDGVTWTEAAGPAYAGYIDIACSSGVFGLLTTSAGFVLSADAGATWGGVATLYGLGATIGPAAGGSATLAAVTSDGFVEACPANVGSTELDVRGLVGNGAQALTGLAYNGGRWCAVSVANGVYVSGSAI